MRTRFSSHPTPRDSRSVSPVTACGSALTRSAPANSTLAVRPQLRAGLRAARRLTLALAASAPLCAGALLTNPAQAAPSVESDENGPLVQILKPGYNDVLKGKYRILIQVTARKYSPQSVEMFIDDKSATEGPMEISSFASSSYDLNTLLLTEGRHKLTVRVTDSQGFRGWSEVTVFVNNEGVVNTQMPDLRWVGLDPFQEVSGAMKIEVDAEGEFGVKWLHLSINPVATPNQPAYSWMMNKPPYRVNLDTIGKNIPDGLYVVKALAFDSLDQQREATPLTIGVLNNQINSTRVEEMLEGRRQMNNVLQGKAPTDAKAIDAKAIDAKAAATAGKAMPKATASDAKAAPATARTSAPGGAARALPELSAVPVQPGYAETPPRLLPALKIPEQTFDNPGIQLPPVNKFSMPQATAPTNAIATRTPATAGQTTEDGVRIARVEPADIAPQADAPLETSTVEAAKVATDASDQLEKTRVAALPSRPVGQRNAGQASLSRSAAIDLAVAPIAPVTAERAGTPIEIARFSQPRLDGRAIADAPVWSQNSASDDSRLSNAEFARARFSKTRVLSGPQPLAARNLAPAAVRALQTSVPALAERPMLGRTLAADAVKVPASKLTHEAQIKAPAQTASASTPSKAAANPQRLAPLSVAGTNEAVAPAPTLLAKAGVTSAPQLSAPNKPQMSESASGQGVPSKIAGAAPSRAANKSSATRATTMNNERVAALPRPDAAKRDRSGASIVAVPLDAPLQIAAATMNEIPTVYRAERATTLRAIAARFGLPVELVAISNNWMSDMKVMSGMEVKLPRPLEVSYNGVPVTGDTPSMLMGDTAVTAFRFMFEKSGGELEWDAQNQRVVARKDGREIVLTIGSNVAKIGEREVMMEIAAFLFQGRTMVPLRFFEEGMNAQVEWNPQTGRLVVAMAG